MGESVSRCNNWLGYYDCDRPRCRVHFTAASGQADVIIDLTANTITWDFDTSLTIPGPENVDTISDANGTIPWIVDVAIDPSTNVAEAHEAARLSFTGNSISLDLGNVSVTPSSVVKLNVKFGPEPEFPWEIFLPSILHGARTQ